MVDEDEILFLQFENKYPTRLLVPFFIASWIRDIFDANSRDVRHVSVTAFQDT